MKRIRSPGAPSGPVRGGGRPIGGTDGTARIVVAVGVEQLRALDAWGAASGLSRAACVRTILADALHGPAVPRPLPGALPVDGEGAP